MLETEKVRLDGERTRERAAEDARFQERCNLLREKSVSDRNDPISDIVTIAKMNVDVKNLEIVSVKKEKLTMLPRNNVSVLKKKKSFKEDKLEKAIEEHYFFYTCRV